MTGMTTPAAHCCGAGEFCGTSGGATFSGAMKLAETAPPNTTILCMLPDTGERYLSTWVYRP